MTPSYYGLLELPSTATRQEIRDAYRRQLERVRSGGSPVPTRGLLDRAYRTLENPDRRIRYDAALAERSLRRTAGRTKVIPLTRGSNRFVLQLGTILAVPAALAAVFALVMVVLPSPGSHRPVAPAAVVLPVSDVANTTPPQQAIDSRPASAPSPVVETAAEPASDSPPATDAPQADDSVQPAAVAAPIAVQPRPAGQTSPPLARQPAPSEALTQAASYQEDTAVAADDSQADAEQPSPAVAESAPTSYGQSAPIGPARATSSARTAFRVPGWFCHDATGGEIFVAQGAPVPGGVSC